jgi:hypothetical protein
LARVECGDLAVLSRVDALVKQVNTAKQERNRYVHSAWLDWTSPDGPMLR